MARHLRRLKNSGQVDMSPDIDDTYLSMDKLLELSEQLPQGSFLQSGIVKSSLLYHTRPIGLESHYKKVTTFQRWKHIEGSHMSLYLCQYCNNPAKFGEVKTDKGYQQGYKPFCHDCSRHHIKLKVKEHSTKSGALLKKKKWEGRHRGYELIEFIKDDAGLLSYKFRHESCGVISTISATTAANRLSNGQEQCPNCNPTEPSFAELPEGYNRVANSFGRYILSHDGCGKQFEIAKTTFYSRLSSTNNLELCTNCNPLNSVHPSAAEQELADCISELYGGEMVRSYRDGYELDIYLPELGMAFEYNGTYWHSVDAGKPKSYHKDKTEYFAEKGISVFHIWEHDWLYSTEKIKAIIRNKLGKSGRRIYARKCDITTLDYSTFSKFVDAYHIQGSLPGSHYYGLEYGGELVMAMSFIKRGGGSYEIGRLCTVFDLVVPGGASRLLSHFMKQEEFDYIYTFALRDLFTGSVYESMGMQFEKFTGPGYHYYYPNETGYCHRFNRIKFTKSKLLSKHGDSYSGMSEFEIMSHLGYLRVYNSGNIRYGLKA